MRRLVVAVRYWWWRAQGTGGHLPSCRHVPYGTVGRERGVMRYWTCAPGCPVVERRRLEGRRYLERWTGHRGR